MRSWHGLAPLLVLALVSLTVQAVPGCIDTFIGTPPDWIQQRNDLHSEARATVEKYHKRHGKKPLEEWPERDRQIYVNAKRLLAEMETKKKR
jgi:hypothetical protein